MSQTNRWDDTPDKQCPAVSPCSQRKYAALWQRYLHWDTLMRDRVRHVLRMAAIAAERTGMDAAYEEERIKQINPLLKEALADMIECAEQSAPEVWAWMSKVKGLRHGSLAAQLIAVIDDIDRFDTLAQLQRYAGLAVYDGKAESKSSEHYSRRLKSILFLIAEQFVRQRTPRYRELYDVEKARQRAMHPQAHKDDAGRWHYNDGHLHMRAMRVVAKAFLRDLWEVWHS